MEGNAEHYVRRNKPGTKREIPHTVSYMWEVFCFVLFFKKVNLDGEYGLLNVEKRKAKEDDRR
jgi:hypothetical protein